MIKKRIHSNYKSIKTYYVEGITTETDSEILNFCDPCNFGGNVKRRGNGCASVEVYID